MKRRVARLGWKWYELIVSKTDLPGEVKTLWTFRVAPTPWGPFRLPNRSELANARGLALHYQNEADSWACT